MSKHIDIMQFNEQSIRVLHVEATEMLLGLKSWNEQRYQALSAIVSRHQELFSETRRDAAKTAGSTVDDIAGDYSKANFKLSDKIVDEFRERTAAKMKSSPNKVIEALDEAISNKAKSIGKDGQASALTMQSNEDGSDAPYLYTSKLTGKLNFNADEYEKMLKFSLEAEKIRSKLAALLNSETPL